MMKRNSKRYDSKRRVLKTGEVERSDGYYVYGWTDYAGKRHSVTASTLEELRKKENLIVYSKLDGIRAEATNVMLNDVYELWRCIKRGLKDNTYQNYIYMYDMFVVPDFGKICVQTLKKSDIKRFYNMLVEERGLKINTVDSIHTVLHRVLQVAVEDRYIGMNVSDNVLTELKKAHNFGNTHRSFSCDAWNRDAYNGTVI